VSEPVVDEIETLDPKGFFFEQVGIKAARLSANFGDGYTRGARIGGPLGLKAWRVRIDALPDLPQYQAGLGQYQRTRARYLWELWERLKLQRNSEIFRMLDPFPRDPSKPYVFAKFQEDEMNWQMFSATVFATGLVLMEARIPHKDPNDFNEQEI
jgi:hypothetical protein